MIQRLMRPYRRGRARPLAELQTRTGLPARTGLHRLYPEEVGALLHQVADERAALRAELAGTRDENLRKKRALRDRQARFGPGVPA